MSCNDRLDTRKGREDETPETKDLQQTKDMTLAATWDWDVTGGRTWKGGRGPSDGWRWDHDESPRERWPDRQIGGVPAGKRNQKLHANIKVKTEYENGKNGNGGNEWIMDRSSVTKGDSLVARACLGKEQLRRESKGVICALAIPSEQTKGEIRKHQAGFKIGGLG